MKYTLLSFFTCLLMISSCKSDQANNKNADSASQQQPIYPVLPAELHQKLYNQVDYLDFIFHDFPFSMSQKEKQSIQVNISYIGQEPVMSKPANCKPVAREFFQIEGEIILEADVYFGENCNFYVFHENGQAKYANQMSYNGVGFFQNIIKQGMDAAKQLGG